MVLTWQLLIISHLNYLSNHLILLCPSPCCQSTVSKYKSVLVFLFFTELSLFLRIMIYETFHYPTSAYLSSFILHYTTFTHTHCHAPTIPNCASPYIHKFLCFTSNSPSALCHFMSPCFRTLWSLCPVYPCLQIHIF